MVRNRLIHILDNSYIFDELFLLYIESLIEIVNSHEVVANGNKLVPRGALAQVENVKFMRAYFSKVFTNLQV